MLGFLQTLQIVFYNQFSCKQASLQPGVDRAQEREHRKDGRDEGESLVPQAQHGAAGKGKNAEVSASQREVCAPNRTRGLTGKRKTDRKRTGVVKCINETFVENHAGKQNLSSDRLV